jgi:CubicO group peptidase (beta-lactamase class C family)
MNADAPMRMASVSKLVCAMGALRLAERGLVDLDADASKALGFRARNPAFPDVPITLRRLLSHTSSLRDGERYWANHPETLSVLFEGAHAQERWGREPPGYFTYCNLNYGLVGQAMEAAAGERFDLLMRRLVFDPLGLACGYNWSGVPRERRAAAAALYRKTGPDGETLDPNGVWTPQIDATAETLDPPTYRSKPNAPDLAAYRLGANGSLFAPQGGLRASVRDLARIGGDLLRALAGQGRAASAEMVARLSDPVWRFDGANGATEGGFYRAFGAGGHILDQGVFGHFGEAYGLRSGLLIDPRRRRVCAYAINGFSREPPPGIAPAERDLIAAAGFAHALG